MAAGGYAWWYVDALSDDGHNGLTIIAFIGSVFSPYYAHARARGHGDPHDHIALNVALYGKGARAWAMTERGVGALNRTQDTLAIGPSALRWDGDALVIDIAEIAFPFLARVRGSVRVYPRGLPGRTFALDADATQLWHPIAPLSRVEVDLSSPSLSWKGNAYFDHNTGTRPVETAFARWHWSRQAAGERTRILYDVTQREGGGQCLALEAGADGGLRDLEAPARASLPASRIWRIARATRCDAGQAARVVKTLEDTPFYARSLVTTSLWGETGPCVHESLDLDRFKSRIVQAMLPFRMPRRTF